MSESNTLSDGRRFYHLVDRGPAAPPDTFWVAVKTGRVGPPKAGEWYISGAIPEAYVTHVDLDTPHALASLVLVEVVTTYRVIE